MKRITIKWVKKTKEALEGIVTLDDFKTGDVMKTPETTTCSCQVDSGSVGMSGIGKDGLVVHLSEEELQQVFELIRWYWAGLCKRRENYHWFLEEEKCCKKKKKVPAAKPRLSSQKGCRTL